MARTKIRSEDITAGQIAATDLADDAVTTDKILDDAVDADKLANAINTSIAANTAKVTNATHTGDVTGATALTIAADAVDIAMLSATGTADATTFLRGDNSWVAPSGGLFVSYAVIVDQKAVTTNGGTATGGTTWYVRDLNTELADPDGIVSISSNRFTLAAGNYLIQWTSPFFRVEYVKTQLYDYTNTTSIAVGVSGFTTNTGDRAEAVKYYPGAARVTPSGSTEYEIQYKCYNTQSGSGLGIGYYYDSADVEQYTLVQIFKEA